MANPNLSKLATPLDFDKTFDRKPNRMTDSSFTAKVEIKLPPVLGGRN